MTETTANPDAIATEILEALAARRQIAPFSERLSGFTMDRAYKVVAALRRARVAGGARHTGRKIGFTNRAMWEQFGIDSPFWGDMFDNTVADLAAGEPFDLSAMLEPRIEPEIVFGMAAAPEAGMDEAALLGCVEWAAHGFEVVQSLYPGYRLTAPDAVAGLGMHGALLIGPRLPVADVSAESWLRALSSFTIELDCNGETIDRGSGANVLGGPLTPLRHLVEMLANDPDNPPLAAGDIVTTGSLTGAFPVAPGERWSTRIEGLPLEGIEVAFA